MVPRPAAGIAALNARRCSPGFEHDPERLRRFRSFVNAPEVRALTGDDPTAPAWVERHADDLVATLLPGLGEPPHTTPPTPEG